MKNLFANRRLRGAIFLGSALLLAGAASSQAANLTYTVYINTASLTGNANAPFSLDVVLGSGAQTPNGANTVTLGSFIATNGTLGPVTYTNGGQSGSTASTVTLTTTALDNEFAAQFSNGTTAIQFNVTMTNTTDNPFPDQFDVAILDSGLNNITTTAPGGSNVLLAADITSAQTLASVRTYGSSANGAEPGVTLAVPEPSPVAAVLAGLGLLGIVTRCGTRLRARI